MLIPNYSSRGLETVNKPSLAAKPFSLPVKLIFTDLDGSLLDHHSYSFQPAEKMLVELEQLGIPVIPITSKTKAELLPLRSQLNNQHPFIIENGAAIYIPCGYSSQQPENSKIVDNFWVIENAASRSTWQALLESETADFSSEYQTFDSAFKEHGPAGISQLTGLTHQLATLANQRDYSEPVHWTGTPERKKLFAEKMQSLGATVLQGGRFLNIGGNTDKGRALLQLEALYLQEAAQEACQTLAIGDSGNDISMLEQASAALIIKSDHHSAPTLARSENIAISTETGPQGWASGVADWLQVHR